MDAAQAVQAAHPAAAVLQRAVADVLDASDAAYHNGEYGLKVA